jgi:CTP:molybdopterin cytidylyltransferase MocA
VRACGLVLAAGAGRRFGDESKLLAELSGKPLIQHVVAAATAALERVVVVLGCRAAEVRERADLGDAEVTVCPDWERGQAASLRHGLALLDECERVIVLLADQPLVPPELIVRLGSEPPGSRAAYGGVPGHPAVLGPREIALARGLQGDQGLRDLVAWRLVEAGSAAVGRDVDTPADLVAIRRDAGRSSPPG